MAHPQTARQPLLPWLMLGPLFAGAGAGIGFWWRDAPPPVLEAAPPRPRPAGVPSFAPVVAAARDAVVGVRTIHRMDPEVLLEDQPAPEDAAEGVTRGTGFVIHEDGLVVTAQHVVARPNMIVVEIPGYGSRAADVVGEDPVTDIAVLRIVDPPADLPSLPLGRSEDVFQGDWVVTIGNPLLLRQTVAAGVVGYVGRHIGQGGDGVTNEHLQFGAPAYPGSSGSPVLDAYGDVVGMTTRAAAEGEGFAFAVTSGVMRRVIGSMERNGGHVRRAHFGCGVRLASGRPRLGVHPDAEGIAVELWSVAKGYAAHRAGLRDGDVVVALDGRPIESLASFYDALTWAEPGTEVSLEVVRGPERLGAIAVELGELGDPPQELTQ